MTSEEQRARHREEQRLYRSRHRERANAQSRKYRASEKGQAKRRAWRERNGEQEAFRKFVWREENKEYVAERLKAWKAVNPGHDANQANWKRSPAGMESQRQRSRRRYLAGILDRKALALRITANIEAVVPRTLPTEARTAVIAALAEAIYTGAIKSRPTRDEARTYIAAHFRMFTKFGPVSLDTPRFDDGRGSYHDIVSEGLWQ